MNREGNHFLNSEFCFFDGKYKRCRGFVTLTASVYHALLRKQVTLAVMEAETEDTENVALFWTLFNEVLRKVSGDQSKMFNPTGWCTDMAGANLAGLCTVYGAAAKYRIKSCEFHFKDHRNKKANKLDPESSEEFKELCEQLLESITESQYDSVKKRLDSFISANDKRSFLGSWLSWWHDRRGFIFRAFAPNNAPCMNQAEVIHAGWAHRDRSNLSLLDVCHADVRDAIVLDVELKAYGGGTAAGGEGPSYIQRKRKQYVREIDQAKQLGAEMFQHDGDENNERTIDPATTFHPVEKKTRSKKSASGSKKKSKNDNQVMVTGTSTNYNNTPLNLAPSRRPPLCFHPSVYGTGNNTAMAGIYSANSTFLQVPQAFPLPGFPVISTTVANNSVSPMSTQPPSVSLLGMDHMSSGLQTTTQSTWATRQGTSYQEWHSGMSPHQYEIMLLPNKVRKCYGCGSDFAEKYRKEPHNLIVRHVDRRVVKKSEETGMLVYSNSFSNTYYHLLKLHIMRKNPVFTGLAFISHELVSTLNERQSEILNDCDINVVIK